MSSNGRFVAQLLEASAAGYAGLATSLLFERHPEITTRYEPNGFSSWKDELRRWLLDLSAAVDAGEPKLFEARMLWIRNAFVARQAGVEDLQAALVALGDILRERLPAGSAETAIFAVDRAIEAVANPPAGQLAEPGPQPLSNRPALAYLEAILAGKPREAIARMLAAVDGGVSVRDAYLNVLMPAQREAGRMWHANELSIAEEHAITSTTQRAMVLLCERGGSAAPRGKTALLACVAGNVHDVAIRAISDFFEMAGWRAINLGSDVPHDEIAMGIRSFDADVVVLAATLDPHVKAVQRTIERIRAIEDRKVKVIVGGPAFEEVPDLWRKVGADGHSASVEDTEPLAFRLTGP